jgi:hypothetical protein
MLLSKINNSVFMRAKTEECAKKKPPETLWGWEVLTFCCSIFGTYLMGPLALGENYSII